MSRMEAVDWSSLSPAGASGSITSVSASIVSAGAKIPIMPVEKSPPPYVVNRSLLRTEEVPRLVKGERRARDQRTATDAQRRVQSGVGAVRFPYYLGRVLLPSVTRLRL